MFKFYHSVVIVCLLLQEEMIVQFVMLYIKQLLIILNYLNK